jgi:hypothetical protein
MAFSGEGRQELDCNKERGRKSRCRMARDIGVRGILEKEVMEMCDGAKKAR